MYFSVYSNKGKIRNENEDSYLIKKESSPLIAVADGMGGHQAGEVASKIAVKSLDKYLFDYQKDLLEELRVSFKSANKEIIDKGKKNEDLYGMGTTLSTAIIHKNTIYIAHIGDSRIYLLRDNELKQLTTDHSLVNELLENKEITCQEAFDHPQKNIITQALGTAEDLKIETKKLETLDGDRLLFSTDGLHDMLRFNEIKKNLTLDKDIEELSKLLGEQAMNKGGNDNITLVIVDLNKTCSDGDL